MEAQVPDANYDESKVVVENLPDFCKVAVVSD